MAVKKQVLPFHEKPKPNYLFKVGKEYYLRMMPTPFKNIKPKLPKL
jgi:hypothetical protein